MRKAGTQEIAFVFEYRLHDGDIMSTTLATAIENRLTAVRCSSVHGLFRTYAVGGLRPSRLINFLIVYARTAFRLIVNPPAHVIVRTTPPGIQVWVALWAAWRGVPVTCWMMDYHPEMEARMLERRGWCRLANLLRRLDSAAMKRFVGVIVLDRAMGVLARARMRADRPLIIHPTWAITRASEAWRPAHGVPRLERGVRRLVYAGNLGAAHDATSFARLIAAASERGALEVHLVGSSLAAEAHLRALTKPSPVKIYAHPRMPFDCLGKMFTQIGADAGIVLLADEQAGLLSPSKFVSYVVFGLPMLYIGPDGTNAHLVCTEYRGGFALRNAADDLAIAAAVLWLWSDDQLRATSRRLSDAAEYFGRLDAAVLADHLVPIITSISPRGRSVPPFEV